MKSTFLLLSAFVATLLLSSCNSIEQKPNTSLQNLGAMGKQLDSAIIEAKQTKDNLDKIEAAVKVLLVQYYKAGWMDASNGLIDLHNKQSLTDYNVQKNRNKDWRRIETEVESRSAIPNHP